MRKAGESLFVFVSILFFALLFVKPVYAEECDHDWYLTNTSYEQYNSDEIHYLVNYYECRKCSMTRQEWLPRSHNLASGKIVGYENYSVNQHYVIKDLECSACHQILRRRYLVQHAYELYETKYVSVSDEEHKKVSTYHCTLCGGEKVVESLTMDHRKTFKEDNFVEPTCSNDGSYDVVEYCELCGKEFSRVTHTGDPATGEHAWDDGVVTKESTIDTEGEVTYTCAVCGEKRTEPQAKLISLKVTPPACGTTVKAISGGEGMIEYNPAPDVQLMSEYYSIDNSWWLEKDENGFMGFSQYEKDFSITGGESYYIGLAIRSKDTNFSSVSEIIPVKGEGCTVENYGVQDERIVNVVIKVEAEHDLSEEVNENVVAPTCGKAGSHDVVTRCKACKKEFRKTVTDEATGEHTWDDGKITKEATTEAEGEKTYTCTVCGETKTEVIPKQEEIDDSTDAEKQMGEDGTAFGKGASAEAVEKAITTLKNDNDPAGTVFSALKLRPSKVAKKTITLKWDKVKNAKQYVLYGNHCGTKYKYVKLKTLKASKKSFKVKKIIQNGKKVSLKAGNYYKFLMVALDKDGNVLTTSKTVHCATTGGKVGNPKKVTTKAKKNKVALKVKKSFKLGAKTVAASKKLKVKKHRAIKYESTNKKIAAVNKSGKITAKKAGTCYVYAYAQNGLFAKIKVTVKK